MKRSLRIACIAQAVPESTGTGQRVATFGLGAALKEAGHNVEFILQPSEVVRACPNQNEFRIHALSSSGDRLQSLSNRLREIRAECVWIIQHDCWAYFQPLSQGYPHVFFAFDSPFESKRLRHELRMQSRSYPRRVWQCFRFALETRRLLRHEARIFAEACVNGVAATYTEQDARRLRGVLPDLNVVYCPIPFPDPGFCRSDRRHPNSNSVLLLGHLGGAHSRLGLRYFFDQVWPSWKADPVLTNITIRIVGGGSLPPDFRLPEPDPRLEWIGFVPDLAVEWSRALALLVPVPLKEGLRTRIVEAWARGVPVVAHPNATTGMPGLVHNENYLAASTGPEWVYQVRRLIDDFELGNRLVACGRRAFERKYSIEACGPIVDQLTRAATAAKIEALDDACVSA